MSCEAGGKKKEGVDVINRLVSQTVFFKIKDQGPSLEHSKKKANSPDHAHAAPDKKRRERTSCFNV